MKKLVCTLILALPAFGQGAQEILVEGNTPMTGAFTLRFFDTPIPNCQTSFSAPSIAEAMVFVSSSDTLLGVIAKIRVAVNNDPDCQAAGITCDAGSPLVILGPASMRIGLRPAECPTTDTFPLKPGCSVYNVLDNNLCDEDQPPNPGGLRFTNSTAGDVRFDYRIAPDSSLVSLSADYVTESTFSIYAPAIDADLNPLANDPLESGEARPSSIAFSDDSRYLVYLSDKEVGGIDEVYSVPTDGSGSPTKLNGPLPSDEVVYFVISPDSTHVVYLCGNLSLFTRPIDGGGSPVLLHAEAGSPVISPNSQWVMFFGGDSMMQVSPLDGTSPPILLVTTPLGSPGGTISVDSQTVIFTDRTAGLDTLYSVPIDGSEAPTLLDAPPPTGFFRITHHNWIVLPDASRLVYEVSLLFIHQLRSVPLDGSEPALVLSGPDDVRFFQLPPAGDLVVYVEGSSFVANELYATATDGSTGPTLLDVRADIPGSRPIVNADGTRAVYLGDPELDSVWDIYSVDTSGGSSPVRLDGTTDVENWAITPDGRRVLFLNDLNIPTVVELYSVPIDNGTPRKLNDFLGAGGDVTSFQVSPDGSRVVYLADQEVDEEFQLYSNCLAPRIDAITPAFGRAGGGNTVVLSGCFPAESSVTFDGISATFLRLDETTLEVVVPQNPNTPSPRPSVAGSPPLAHARAPALSVDVVVSDGITSAETTYRYVVIR